MGKIFLGVVADDFTGASDAASFLAAAGLSVVLFNGIPKRKRDLREDVNAIVVALKTRTVPASQAVKESLEAFSWLKEMGAEQLYLKYCSTFDSTKEGNIGPVTDAVLDTYGIPYTLLCPALPVNGRTVRGGKLYVNGVLLEESHMKYHPLTPMRDSDIARLMESQGKYRGVVLPLEDISAGAVEDWTLKAQKTGPLYLIPDYYDDSHGDLIAGTFGSLAFLTGGSGLAGALGRRYARQMAEDAPQNGNGRETAADRSAHRWSRTEGRALILAGSCSAVTLKQIREYQSRGFASFQISPHKLLDGSLTREMIWQWISSQKDGALVYSSASPEDIKKSQALGKERVAAAIEEILSDLAEYGSRHGYHRLIIAGGETSGAVTKKLGYEAFYVGASVAPGVPVMTPLENPEIRLVLKSGNFGQEDFFWRAKEMTEKGANQ